MVKDRFPELLRVRKNSILARQEDCAVDTRWLDFNNILKQISEIHDNIKNLKTLVSKAKKLQEDIEVSPIQENYLKRKLKVLKDSITSQSNFVRIKLRNIQPESKQHTSTMIVERIKSVQYDCLLQEFLGTMESYNISLEDYQHRCKERIQRQMNLLGETSMSDARLHELMEKDIYIFNLNYEVDIQRKQLTNIQTRHKEILDLETSIKDVQQAFSELQVAVNKQSNQIDSIEKQVINSQCTVEAATVQLNKAVHVKRKSKAMSVLLLPFKLVQRIHSKTI